MTGEFFDPTPKALHHCELPPFKVTYVFRGWICECGKAYEAEHLGEHDTNQGESPYQWKRSPRFDRTSTGWDNK